jgi:hypothetical protein
MSTMRWSKLRKAALTIGGVLAVFTAVVGFAHTTAGRPLLGWMGAVLGHGGAVCPLGYGRAATPEQREQARARFAEAHRGDEPSQGRPALGFALDAMTREDVARWASSHDVSCGPGRGPADLACDAVPDALLPEAFRGTGQETLWFVFGAGERLVSVTAIASADAPDPIRATFQSVVAYLGREAGPPSMQGGDAATLASGALRQATAEYRFRDYYAVVRATNVGRGYALTEEYRSLPN